MENINKEILDKENAKNIFFIKLLCCCGILIENLDELDGYSIDRNSLLNMERYELVKKHFVELKKYLSSSMFTSLHENAGKNQKSPLINLVRQVLKWLGYELNPKRLSDGYSEDGKKRYRRIFIIKKIEKTCQIEKVKNLNS